jgi:Ankyrin repeats (3 copies)
MPPAARSVEELFPLIKFCKDGDLKATSGWIAKGNPLDLPPGKKTRRASPLQIAIEKGFLTLTETLLDAGADPSSNGNPLWVAVRAKRIDIVRLLLDSLRNFPRRGKIARMDRRPSRRGLPREMDAHR